ncbi:uncharacterized protein LOC134462860 [Engraulis encrasicolus]|uniref:uncharacterized protein LOC134462860 n=1 Tax=Engraulis encrasicolus TaxID=184585 RepID=UPI002FD64AE8
MTALTLLQAQMQELTSSGQVAGVGMDDMYSISSVSPLEDDPPPLPPPPPSSPPIRLLGTGGEEATTATSPRLPMTPQGHSSHENLSSPALRVSPLEAIRELDEATEESLSGQRSPGDGAVRGAKDQLAVGKELPPPQSAEKGTEDLLALEDCEEEDSDDTHIPVVMMKRPLRSIITTSKSIAVLETAQSEACRSQQSISDLVCLREDSQTHSPQTQKSLRVGLSEETLGSNSSKKSQRTVVIVGSELEDDTGSSVTSVRGQIDKRSHTPSPAVVPVGSRAELRSSTGTITDLQESNADEAPLQDGVMCINTTRDSASTEQGDSSTLIDILIACKAKVEQLEQLKCSSYELTIQLQSAQALATCLQERVVWLEEEQGRQQREVQGLREELQEARRSLRERSVQTERISQELRLLHLQLQKRPSASGSSEGQEDGHQEEKEVQQEQGESEQEQHPSSHGHMLSTRVEQGSSRVCTLL